VTQDENAQETPRSGHLKVIGPDAQLTLLGGNGGKRHWHLVHPLAAAVWTHHTDLSEVRDVESLGELLVAILAEKNVLAHSHSPAT
jgi:hypothetical protein